VDENVKSFMMMSGVTGSFLEGYVIGETSNCKGVSTVSVITETKRRGIDVVALSKENIEKLSSLKIEKSIKGEIEKALDNGKIVIVPGKNMYYYDWYGTGYVILNPQTGEAAYMISGGPKPNDPIIEEPIEEIIDDVVEPEVPKGGNIGIDLFWEEVAGKYGTEFAKEIETFGKNGRTLIETYEEAGRIDEIIEIINNLPESDRAEAVQLIIDYLDDAVELLKDGKSVESVKKIINTYKSIVYPSLAPNESAIPRGKRTIINYDDPDPDNIRALIRENEAADVLAKYGYVVEQNPTMPGSKNPDYLIEGKIFDCYSPREGTSVRNIGSTIAKKNRFRPDK
jgi:hypothetical protein